jgi:hypothetical protein
MTLTLDFETTESICKDCKHLDWYPGSDHDFSMPNCPFYACKYHGSNFDDFTDYVTECPFFIAEDENPDLDIIPF